MRWPRDIEPLSGVDFPCGVLVLLRQTLRMEQASWTEGPLALHCYALSEGREPCVLDRDQRAILLRGLFRATVRVKPEERPSLTAVLVEQERTVAEENHPGGAGSRSALCRDAALCGDHRRSG
jgi:hypothetical protein